MHPIRTQLISCVHFNYIAFMQDVTARKHTYIILSVCNRPLAINLTARKKVTMHMVSLFKVKNKKHIHIWSLECFSYTCISNKKKCYMYTYTYKDRSQCIVFIWLCSSFVILLLLFSGRNNCNINCKKHVNEAGRNWKAG